MFFFLKSSVGKKILMGLTGWFMLLFVIAHVLGNTTLFFRWINTYAEHLHALPALIWFFRLFLLAALTIHVWVGLVLTLENRAAKGEAYAVKKSLKTTFAAKNMIWTGALIGAFLIYHLLHFTVQVISPEISARANMDLMGRPDVFRMVVLNFQKISVAGIYVGGMMALLLHLSHGIQSSFQTLGLNNDRTLQVTTKAGTLAAVILFLGYAAIPVVIAAGLLK